MPRASRHLLEPITTPEAFAQVIGDLVADLTRQLLTRGTGVRRLDLLFERVDGHVQGGRGVKACGSYCKMPYTVAATTAAATSHEATDGGLASLAPG